MACDSPLHGWFARQANPTGKRSIVFNKHDGFADLPVSVPCGQCLGCRLERSRQWAIRCMHESQMHDFNSFITLTFDDKYLVPSLDKADFPKFMKRFRKAISPLRVSYFHCGEYGDQLGRPHHHACIFGFDFPDKVLWSIRRDVRLYRSDFLESLWPFGFSTIGDVTFESAAYVARYVTKKVTGKLAADHYGGRVPEHVSMSRRPAIGKSWLQKFSSDVFPSDRVVVRQNIQCAPPKYYRSQFELINSEEAYRMRVQRKLRAKDNPNNTTDRLHAREVVRKQKAKLLHRSFENET